MHSYVARRLGSDLADDLASETFLVAFRQRAKFDGRNGVVRAWLYGIATNLIRRHRRDEVRAWRARRPSCRRRPRPAASGQRPAASGHEERVAAQVTAQSASREPAAELAKVAPEAVDASGNEVYQAIHRAYELR